MMSLQAGSKLSAKRSISSVVDTTEGQQLSHVVSLPCWSACQCSNYQTIGAMYHTGRDINTERPLVLSHKFTHRRASPQGLVACTKRLCFMA